MIKEAFEWAAVFFGKQEELKNRVIAIDNNSRIVVVNGEGIKENIFRLDNSVPLVCMSVEGVLSLAWKFCESSDFEVLIATTHQVHGYAFRADVFINSLSGAYGSQSAMSKLELSLHHDFKMLTAHGPEKASEWARWLRTEPIANRIPSLDTVVAALQDMKWESSATYSETGVGTSRASYGGDAIKTVTAKSETLPDFVCNLQLINDPACQISQPVRCFWSYDHANKTLDLHMDGRDLAKLVERTSEWFHQEFQAASEEIGFTYVRGA